MKNRKLSESSAVICLTGMHRSGTSAAAGLLHLMGVHLGRETELIGALADNPKGFWEHRGIVELNEEILARRGGSWLYPPQGDDKWPQSVQLADLQLRAEEIIGRDFSTRAVWGFKDPRSSLTLAFWQTLLPNLKCVVCVRDPWEVIQSLSVRDYLAPEHSLFLWLVYSHSVLDRGRDSPISFVFYEALLEGTVIELRRVWSELGLKQFPSDDAVARDIDRFVEKDLRHFHALESLPSRDQTRFGCVLSEARDLAIELCVSGTRAPTPLMRRLRQAIAELEPESSKSDWQAHRRRCWNERRLKALHDIDKMVPSGKAFLLADEQALGVGPVLNGRACVPFLEHHGSYWGLPPDDETAVRELERLKDRGVHFLIFAWPAFWWLHHYAGFREYLEASYRRTFKNDRIDLFDISG